MCSPLLRPRLLLAFLALALAACDSGGPSTGNDQIAGGVNLTRLFAPASASEIQTVRGQWAARASATQGVTGTVVSQATIGNATVYVVSHPVTTGPGAPLTHYGLVRIPAGAVGRPVLVVHHGGDNGLDVAAQSANTGLVQMAAAFPDLFAQTVQVLPVYRSEELRTAGYAALGGPYRAGGSASPWDYDVDDSMALLSAVLALFPAQTDAGRVGALGFSRGGNVALLHAIRDGRIGAVTNYYGPSDFYNQDIQNLGIGLLAGLPSALGLPGGRFLLENVLAPLRGPDGRYNPNADYDGARLEVVRRSASLFTADLPPTQVHHHRRDPVVPFGVSAAFDARAQRSRPRGAYEFNAYGEAPTSNADLQPIFHAPEGFPQSLAATQAFMQARLIGPPTLAARPPATRRTPALAL
ncbi:MAG: alpha/beta hydrolase family protein [Rubricoccaceae bacterium]